jgi:hypothetical protein
VSIRYGTSWPGRRPGTRHWVPVPLMRFGILVLTLFPFILGGRLGGVWLLAAELARSAGWSCRAWRSPVTLRALRPRSVASFDAGERASSTIQTVKRTNVRYSIRTVTGRPYCQPHNYCRRRTSRLPAYARFWNPTRPTTLRSVRAAGMSLVSRASVIWRLPWHRASHRTFQPVWCQNLWVPKIVALYATWEYSRIRPPSRSRRRTQTFALGAGGCGRPAGGPAAAPG